MKITEIRSLAISDVKVVRFERFADSRGYFTELFRLNDFRTNELLKDSFKDAMILQQNESYSAPMVVRGLHFQWNPFMGKLVRTIQGRMIDIVLDIRKGSPTFGKAIMHDMPSDPAKKENEWIWVPPGFAHGNFFTESTSIEYNCTGDYSPGCEAGISPLAADIDWSLCDADLLALFKATMSSGMIISDKDQAGLTLNEWVSDQRSDNFLFGKC